MFVSGRPQELGPEIRVLIWFNEGFNVIVIGLSQVVDMALTGFEGF
jgi:hypothetical protein